MTHECTDIERETARAGDRYYTAFTRWLATRGESIDLREQASLSARIYRKGLRLALRCLERLRPTPAISQKIASTRHLETHLTNDIKFLNSSAQKLMPAADEN